MCLIREPPASASRLALSLYSLTELQEGAFSFTNDRGNVTKAAEVRAARFPQEVEGVEVEMWRGLWWDGGGGGGGGADGGSGCGGGGKGGRGGNAGW